MPDGKAGRAFARLALFLGALQVVIDFPCRSAHQLCLSPLVKSEFKPHCRNSLSTERCSFYTGVSMPVFAAACLITVHKMPWYCSRTIRSDSCLIFFCGCAVVWEVSDIPFLEAGRKA